MASCTQLVHTTTKLGNELHPEGNTPTVLPCQIPWQQGSQLQRYQPLAPASTNPSQILTTYKKKIEGTNKVS